MNTAQLIALAGNLVESGWELSAEDFDALLADFVDRATDKIAALNAVHTAAASRQAGLKAEAAAYTAAAKTAGNVAERVKSRAFDLALAAREAGEELPGIRIQANGGVIPVLYSPEFSARNLPTEYQIVTIEPDVKLLLAALQAGQSFDGVTLGERGEHARFVPVAKSK